jgi:hypothetical protein
MSYLWFACVAIEFARNINPDTEKIVFQFTRDVHFISVILHMPRAMYLRRDPSICWFVRTQP